MSASLINQRIHSQAGFGTTAINSRKVSLNRQDGGSAVSFSEAMNVLFAGAKENKIVSEKSLNQDSAFDPAASDNVKVREFAALEPKMAVNDFELLERNPASGSDFSVLDALSDGLMFASRIAGAVMAVKPF